MSLQTPIINVKDISDPVLRRNFQNLVDYFRDQNQLLDFVFLEAVFTAAEANRKIRHGLGVTPKDVIVTQLTGTGPLTFNFGLFDDTNLDLSATAACRVRFLVGTKVMTGSEVDAKSADTQTYTP